MSAATPSPQDAGLPPPASLPAATFSDTTSTFSDNASTNETSTKTTTPFANPADPAEVTTTIDTVATTEKPTILHLGDDIRWNHEMYMELGRKFHIERSHSMGRDEFMKALRERKWCDFVGMYRPFWNTGGEMGNWNEELM
jgi:hypothetical protein